MTDFKKNLTMPKISNEEWLEISTALEGHHAVFYKIWQMGKPVFNEECPTAAVQFDEMGEFIYFHFNPTFWQRLNFYGKLFVICHEALHIILNHGMRIRDSGINRRAANSALDIVVNHNLVNGFGFERKKIDDIIRPIFKKMALENGHPWNSEEEKYSGLCWVDTIFRDRDPIPKDNEMFEYYYNLFEKMYGDGGPGTGELGPGQSGGSMDDHSMMGEEKSDAWDKVIDNLSKELTEDEKKSIKSMIDKNFQQPPKNNSENTQAGSGTGGQWVFAKTGNIVKKKKWETVIKKWANRYIIKKDKDTEQWARINRRLTFLPRDMFLPSDMEMEENENEKKRIKVFFFLDTSGSCWGLKNRFFAAAESLPTKLFDVRLFCFDTVVKETTLASKKIYGGGGTLFSILEDHIQSIISRENQKYPEAIFVITDGHGNTINPQKPEAWYWFITQGGTKNYINNNCNFFNLQDYE